MALALQCTNEQKIPVTVKPTTAAGNPATFDGPLKFTVQSGEATVQQDPTDPNTFFVVSGEDPGLSSILVEGDADLGPDVSTIQDIITLTVSGAQAASFGFSVGTAVPK